MQSNHFLSVCLGILFFFFSSSGGVHDLRNHLALGVRVGCLGFFHTWRFLAALLTDISDTAKLHPLNIQPVVVVRGLKRQQVAALTNFVGCFFSCSVLLLFLSFGAE